MALRRNRRIATAFVIPKVEVWKDTTAGELLRGDVYRDNGDGSDLTVWAVIKVERTFSVYPVLVRQLGLYGRSKGRTIEQSYTEFYLVDVLEFDNVVGK